MHLGKFHYAIRELNLDYISGEIAGKILAVILQLDNLAANPGHPSFAASFKEQLEVLRKQLASSVLNKPYPTLLALLDSIDAPKFVGDRLFQRIEACLSDNGMTPQLAATSLRALQDEITNYFNEITALDDAFEKLSVEYEEIEPGEGEIGISIPEPEGDRLLITLSDTAKKWDQALRPFVELADHVQNPIVVRTISSSDWQFYLDASPAVLLLLSGAISQLNVVLNKLVETKQLILQLVGLGTSDGAIATVIEENDGKLNQETRNLAEKIVDENPPEDAGRSNELKIAVTTSLKFMARQMVENVTIEIRYIPPGIPAPDVAGPQREEDGDSSRIGKLTAMAEQIERNMDLILRLDASAKKILNLPAPEEEAES